MAALWMCSTGLCHWQYFHASSEMVRVRCILSEHFFRFWKLDKCTRKCTCSSRSREIPILLNGSFCQEISTAQRC
ncbi:uncharacterized protein K444DRAFT_350435 [Hyaloscypha bicolor E]|uniref:Uncharacterized protein n=1 Tax=Hyaloscypha bicolor E TaxID=1095630 RepID=A0A2J6TIF7_9HELO|nr:uncharacterized protein K444DRAFT_350435 [Hyaloscypha bicolor E]PMD62806.1 hypothetical protein K444DRAFT_350435 [Hyaloscypha bicolor E]